MEPKILLLDLETFPNIGYVWGKYEQNVIRYVQQSCIASYAAKWLNNKKIIAKALPDYSGYTPRSYDDRELVSDLWALLDEADIIVAHNGNSFDVKVCNARFMFHGLMPPSPYKTVDTKKVVKEVARFNSNKLDDLTQIFDLGEKIQTTFDLWEGCINGDKKAWNDMISYNRHDILLLEKLYLKVLPWIKNHPNLTLWTEGNCPKCGSFEVQYRGYQFTLTRKYRRFQCIACGGWGRSVKCEKGENAMATNVAD